MYDTCLKKDPKTTSEIHKTAISSSKDLVLDRMMPKPLIKFWLAPVAAGSSGQPSTTRQIRDASYHASFMPSPTFEISRQNVRVRVFGQIPPATLVTQNLTWRTLSRHMIGIACCSLASGHRSDATTNAWHCYSRTCGVVLRFSKNLWPYTCCLHGKHCGCCSVCVQLQGLLFLQGSQGTSVCPDASS